MVTYINATKLYRPAYRVYQATGIQNDPEPTTPARNHVMPGAAGLASLRMW
jgi:hypothetical protein